MNDPRRLAEMVRIQPYSKGGKFIGYRLGAGRDRTLLSTFGLRPGDVVTAVNGITLETTAKGLNVLRKLTNADRVRVDILRNGVRRSFVIDINK